MKKDWAPTTIVIGCGSGQTGDDAAGLEVVAALAHPPQLGFEVRRYEDGWPAGFLAELPAEALVIFVAAVHSNAFPGTICCLKLPSKTVSSRHLQSRGEDPFSLDRELQLARKHNGSAPRTFLVGIETTSGDSEDESSERVRVAVAEIVRNFPRYLKLAREMA